MPANTEHERRLPTGAIIQVESGPAHRAFVEAVEPDCVLLKIQHARRLLNSGETASSWTPERTNVCTSTAIADARNNALPLEHNGYKRGEVDIVREFEPDFHIPADRPDYGDMDPEARYTEIEECMAGTLAVANHVADLGLETTVLPWIKGVLPRERRLAYRTIEQLGMDYAVFYANGYFNDGTGVRINALIEDVEQIKKETATAEVAGQDPVELAVLNCQSPNVVGELPPNVVAASGLWVGQNRGWREKITPTKQSPEEMRRIYKTVSQRVREALGRAETEDQPQEQIEPRRQSATSGTHSRGEQP